MERTYELRAVAQRGPWLIMLSAALWGTVGVTTQALMRISQTNALSIGFFRLALAAPVLLLVGFALLGRGMLRIERRDLGLTVLIGLMLAIYQVCFFAAIGYLGVAVSTLITLCTAPVIVALLSLLVNRERPSGRTLLALAGALAGTVLLVDPQKWLAGQSMELTGVLLALGSAFGYAVMAVSSRGLAGRYHPIQSLAFSFSAGAAVLLPVALISGFVVSYPAIGWGMLLYLGVVPSALGYVCFMMGMRSTTATNASIITLLEPLTATLLAWLLFGEQLGSLGLIGGVLLLGAAFLLSTAEESVQ